MKKTLCVLGAALVLAGCQPKANTADSAAETAPAAPPTASARSTAGEAPKLSSVVKLAYAYALSLEAPAGQISALQRKHEQACQEAGPDVCQVLGEHLNVLGADLEGQLVLRAEPHWLSAFRTGLDADARQAGGRITRSSVETEDLARDLTDGEIQLRNQRAERDRLKAELARRAAAGKDGVEVKAQANQVQGEIDAAQAQLARQRAQVQMAQLTISYATSGFAGTRAFAPVAEAGQGVVRHALSVVAGMVTIAGFVLPIAGLGGLVFWLSRRLSRRRRQAGGDKAPL